MPVIPQILTDRLQLRPFTDADAPVVQRLAGDRRMAETTLLIPHPYPEGAAEAWIATHEATWELGRGLTLAIAWRTTNELLGAIGLSLAPEHHSAEMGYWIGVPFWDQGICTEAARALIDHGFAVLDLNRIHAHHFSRNAASGRVLEKAGMTREGFRRGAILKWGHYEDITLYGIVRSDWERERSR
jgi:ribosomal-protein-alanine N-acetyltransferase